MYRVEPVAAPNQNWGGRAKGGQDPQKVISFDHFVQENANFCFHLFGGRGKEIKKH